MTKYQAREISGRFNCQDCGTRGNVCMDSDGVYRCHGCSGHAFQVRVSKEVAAQRER